MTMRQRLEVQAGASTSHQRLYIRTLLDELGADTRVVTKRTAKSFAEAGLPEPETGIELDIELRRLTRGGANVLAAQLKAEVAHASTCN